MIIKRSKYFIAKLLYIVNKGRLGVISKIIINYWIARLIIPKASKSKEKKYIKIYPGSHVHLQDHEILSRTSGKFKTISNHISFKPFNYFNIESGTIYTDNNSIVSYYDEDSHYMTDASFNFRNINILNPKFLLGRKIIDGSIYSVLTGGGGSSNYFHWLFDLLPRFIPLLKGKDNVDFILIPEPIFSFQKKTLSLLGIPKEKMLFSQDFNFVKCSNLFCTNSTRNGQFINSWNVKFLRKAFLKKLPQTDLKLYISRKDATFRKIINEDEIVDLLVSNGFHILSLSEHDFEDQVLFFSAAKIIISPHGASLANLAFCEKGTRVIELFHPNYITPMYYSLSKILNLDYSYIIGLKTNSNKLNYIVPLDQLKKLCS
jgi:hypothetical protein